MLGDARHTAIVGRSAELALLDAGWARTTQGRGCVVVVGGEAGIGKSRLMQVMIDRVRQVGGIAVCGRAVSTETTALFRPLAEALCSIIRTTGLPQCAELVPFRPLLGRMVPEWAAMAGETLEVSTVALGEAVLRFLRVIAGDQGCAVVLEDLHWADPDTMAVVEYLVDNLSAIPVLCMITVRDEEAGPGLDVLRRLAARRACVWNTMSALEPNDVAKMVAAHLGVDRSPEAALVVADRAMGVPLLIEELLDTAISEGVLVRDHADWRLTAVSRSIVPFSHSDSVRRRLARLATTGAPVIQAAAIIGVFDSDILAAATGTDESAIAAVLGEAARTGLLAIGGDPPKLRFRHALTADAVRASLLPAERVELARRALLAVIVCRPELPAGWCEMAAELARQSGDPDRAAIFLRQLGRRSLDAGELATAQVVLRRANGLVTPGSELAVWIEEDLVEAFALAGDYAHAAEIGAGLLDRLASTREPTARWVTTCLRLARAAAAATRWTDARSHLQAARSEAPASNLSLACRLDALEALVALGEDDAERASKLAEHAWALADQESLPAVACEALEVLGRCRRPSDLDGAEAAFTDQEELAAKHGLRIWRIRAMHELGTVDLLRSVSIDRLAEARELAADLGAVATQAAIELHICAGLLLRGDDPACRDAAMRTVELAGRYGIRHVRAAALGFLAVSLARAGDQAGVERALAEAAADAEGDASFPATAACARAMLAFVADDRSAALDHLDPARLGGPQVRSQDPAIAWWTLLRAMDADGAETAIEAVRPIGSVNVIIRGFLQFTDAVLHGRAGRIASAESAVDEGNRLLTNLPWLRHFALRWMAEAAAADGWGTPEPWLREAESYFTDEGQERLAVACRSLLRRVGAPVPRRRADWPDIPADFRRHGITGREHEVMTLLAEGLPNAVIAQRLYLSPRTVERHIANVCVKVGLQRRSELVAFASRTLAKMRPVG